MKTTIIINQKDPPNGEAGGAACNRQAKLMTARLGSVAAVTSSFGQMPGGGREACRTQRYAESSCPARGVSSSAEAGRSASRQEARGMLSSFRVR